MVMETPDPGLDRHEWESELASLDDGLRDSPAEALPELADLVGRMLHERGYDLDDPVAREGEEARGRGAVPGLARGGGQGGQGTRTSTPATSPDAINGLRELFDSVIAERESP